jgi:hypothetical protein
LRDQAGERSDRIVAPDPPVKGPPGREAHRQSAKESTGSDATHAAMRRHRTRPLCHVSAHRPATPSERERARPRPCRRQRDKTHIDAAEGVRSERRPESINGTDLLWTAGFSPDTAICRR